MKKNNAVASEKIKAPEQSFTVGEEEFRFRVGKFKSDGTVFTAEEALTNPDLLKKLVSKRSGLIKQIFR